MSGPNIGSTRPPYVERCGEPCVRRLWASGRLGYRDEGDVRECKHGQVWIFERTWGTPFLEWHRVGWWRRSTLRRARAALNAGSSGEANT